MTTEDPVVQYHRSFRDRIELEKIAADAKRRRGHLAGVGGAAPKVSDVFDRTYRGYRITGNQLKPVQIMARRDQKFEDYATEWEREWSVLANPANPYLPVLDENLTVIGHSGSSSGGYFADLILPFGAVQHRFRPNDDYYTDDLNGLLRDEIRVFVHNRSKKSPPAGWVFITASTTEHKFDLITGINGEVLDSVRGNTGFLEDVWYSPSDLLSFGKLIATLSVKIGSKVAKTLVRKAVSKQAAKALDGPSAQLAKEAAEKAAKEVSEAEAKMIFKGIKLNRGYDPRMGIPEEHFLKMVEAAKEAGVIAMFRSNKKAAIELIRKGAHGKPMWAKFKTDPNTGILTATNAGEAAAANMNDCFVIGSDGVARRMYKQGDKMVAEVIRIDGVKWSPKPGQVFARDGKPIVGDYDLLGVAPVKSPGRNINVVPEDLKYGDWNGPDVKKYAQAANKRMDEPRVLHGAQDGYGGNPKYMGLTDDTAYAVFPDGRTYIMEGRKAQQEFYDALGREAKSPGAPKGVPGWKPTVIQGGKK
ncbi:hypothetical protein NA78x_002069 [Anatilimnocola sp. NA78]|uniref:hypothetical protein n=1 Tax=Anatilimnocola sp. NA78 TaxID=3415683 RepID=UPI003CE4B561